MSEISDIVLHQDKDLNTALDFWRLDRERMIRNGKMFWGVDHGQWDSAVTAELLSQQRQAPTFNIVDNKIFNLIGLILKNRLDVKFAPMTDEFKDIINKLQDMWFSDYELFDWDGVNVEFLRDMAIMFGCESMVISKKHDPLGNITFEYDNPLLITLDPNWTSPFSEDMVRLWKNPMLIAAQILEIYPNKNEELRDEYERQKQDKNYGINMLYPQVTPENRWGDKHQVIEEHYMETVKEWCEFDMVNREWFPDGDKKSKLKYAKLVGISDDDIQTLERVRKIYKVRASCPTLTREILLENGKGEIQIERIPKFPMGYARFNGHFKGLVDTISDLQQNLNKGLMDSAEIRQRSAKGGSALLDPAMVNNDDTAMANISQGWSTPGFKGWVAPNAFANGKEKFIMTLPETPVPPDLMGLNQLWLNLVDRLSNLPAATEGRSESNRETGRLFQSKYEAGLIAQGGLYKNLEIHWHEKADAYFRQARITYAGNPRRFSGYGGKPSFTINKETKDFDGNMIGVEDDISRLPRIKIVITQSPKGLNVRTNQRMIYAELMHSLPPTLRLIPIDLVAGIWDTLDLSDEKTDELKADIALEKESARAALRMGIAQANFMEAQSKMQLDALMAQQGMVKQDGMLEAATGTGQTRPGQPGQERPGMITPPIEQDKMAQMIAGTPQAKNPQMQEQSITAEGG